MCCRETMLSERSVVTRNRTSFGEAGTRFAKAQVRKPASDGQVTQEQMIHRLNVS
jgi:hypothetical protein